MENIKLKVYLKTFCQLQSSTIDGLLQERHTHIANALELRLSYINPSKCS